MGVNDADFEERILHHLAATAAMGRTHHLGRREGQRIRSSAHGHPHFLVFSTQPGASSSCPNSAAGGGNEPAAVPTGSPSTPITSDGDEPSQQIPHLQTESSSSAINHQGIYSNDRLVFIIKGRYPRKQKILKGGIICSICFLMVHYWFCGLVKFNGVYLLPCRGSSAHSSPVNQDRAGSSEFQSFSDSLRSRLNAVSLRCDCWKIDDVCA